MTLPIDSALLPAEVRSGGAQARKLYATALDFEKLLTTQLTQALGSAIPGGDDAADDGSDDGDGVTSGTSGAGSQLAAQLPGQLADAIAQGGGLGLAPQLYRALAVQRGATR